MDSSLDFNFVFLHIAVFIDALSRCK